MLVELLPPECSDSGAGLGVGEMAGRAMEEVAALLVEELDVEVVEVELELEVELEEEEEEEAAACKGMIVCTLALGRWK